MDPRQKYVQWLRIALSEELTRLGAFLASRRKHGRLPKLRASLKIIRWRESEKSRLCQLVKHRSQNHVEFYWTFLAVRYNGSEFNILQIMHFYLLNSLYPEPNCYSLHYILGKASNVLTHAVNGTILNCEKRSNRRNAYPTSTLSTTNHARTDRWWVTYRLKYGMGNNPFIVLGLEKTGVAVRNLHASWILVCLLYQCPGIATSYVTCPFTRLPGCFDIS